MTTTKTWRERFDELFPPYQQGGPDNIRYMFDPSQLKSFIEITIAEERAKAALEAFEILHKYALLTKDTHALDLIERAQQEILASLKELN